MRNPLHFSSKHFVKRALQDYNAQYKNVLNQKNISGVQDFWKNLQSYPQDVQKKIYEQMGQIEVPGNTYGGFGNMLSHGLSQGWHAIADPLGNWGNSAAQMWGGGRTDLAPELAGNDIIGEKRDEAKRVYDLALKDPQYMARLKAVMPQYEQTVKNEAAQLRANQANPAAPAPANNTYSGSANPAIGSGGPGMFNTSNIKQAPAQAQAPAPAAAPAAAPKAPAPAPAIATSTPAPTQTQTPAPAPTPTATTAPNTPGPQAPQNSQTAPAPVAVQPAPPAPPTPVPTPDLLSTPGRGRQGMRAQRQQLRQEMRDFRQQRSQALGFGQNTQQQPAITRAVAPVATPRKEGLIEGEPASQWIARNKARQPQAAPAVSASPSGMNYDSVSGQMVPQDFNRYNTSTPTQTIQTSSVRAPITPSTPAAPVAQPLAPDAQKMLNAYRNTPAGRFQNMPEDKIREGVISDANYRISRGRVTNGVADSTETANRLARMREAKNEAKDFFKR